MPQNPMSPELQACIRACLECHQACTETAAHVLHGTSGHSEGQHLVALLDCAQIASVSADFMARRSPHHRHVCAECAEISAECARLCDSHADPDGKMKQCAEACRRCSQSCAAMGESRKR